MARQKLKTIQSNGNKLDIPTDEAKQIKCKSVSAKSDNQRELIKSIYNNSLTLAIGAPGCGKTHLSVGCAYDLLQRGEVSRITITRPALEAYEAIGWIPGDIASKMAPYLIPIYDEFLKFIDQKDLDKLLKDNTIRIAPLCFLRGRNLDGITILDEGQNCIMDQLKLFLTRLCPDSKMIITGDPLQSDLNHNDRGAFSKLADSLEGIEDVGVIRLTAVDNCRHKLVPIISKIIENIDKPRTLEDRFQGYSERDDWGG